MYKLLRALKLLSCDGDLYSYFETFLYIFLNSITIHIMYLCIRNVMNKYNDETNINIILSA